MAASVAAMAGTLKSAPPQTNMWDALAYSATAMAIVVSAAGYFSTLSQKPECNVPASDNVDACCGRQAPPALLPIVGFVAALVMPMFTILRGLFFARSFRNFRLAAVTVAARDTLADDRDILETTRISLNNLVRATGSRKFPTLTNISLLAAVQLIVAAFFMFGLPAIVVDTLGTAIYQGRSKGTYTDYYNFECDRSCSILTHSPTLAPTALPTLTTPTPTASVMSTTPLSTAKTDSIQCRVESESPVIFWWLVVAFAINFGGALLIAKFVLDLNRIPSNQHATILMECAAPPLFVNMQ